MSYELYDVFLTREDVENARKDLSEGQMAIVQAFGREVVLEMEWLHS